MGVAGTKEIAGTPSCDANGVERDRSTEPHCATASRLGWRCEGERILSGAMVAGVTAGTRVASCTEKIVDSEDIEFGRRVRRRGGAALDWGAIQRICGGADGFE